MSLSGEQLRDRIDSGETGEKVGHPDPAAAPLGTDEEAGGARPTVFAEPPHVKPKERHRAFPGIALFLLLGFAVVFCVFVSVLIGAS